jgi:hypothetical protein
MTPLALITAFATLLLDFARLGLVALAAFGVMYALAKAMQSAARRRSIAATKRGYAALAGKPVAPPAERRNRTKRAA